MPPETQAGQTSTGRRGHIYDSVKLDGETRGHLGDVFGNVTYNFGTIRSVDKSEGTNEREEKEDPLNKRKRLELLRALEFSAMSSRLASISPAHAKTCDWLVNTTEFKRWQDQSHRTENHGVLWIKGNPGAGKSTLMRFVLGVAEERESTDVVVSYFFNARGHALERSTEGLFRSLLHQILSKVPRLFSARFHILQETWPIPTLENMLRASLLSLNADEHIVCYIDALDECTQDEIRDAVTFFEEVSNLAVSRGLHVSICLSSRHYPHITMQKHEELRLDDQSEHLQDIASYLKSNLGRLAVPQTVQDEIQENIQCRCSGIFLWVVLVIKILKEGHDGGASFTELIASLKAVPEKLQDIFASILHKSGPQTISALKWVLYARKPMRTIELYFAIRTSTNELSLGEWNQENVDLPSMERFILRSARGLVELVRNSNPHHTRTQFIHESVREHLLKGGLADLTMDGQLTFEARTHAQLAECCLSYIHLDLPTYLKLVNCAYVKLSDDEQPGVDESPPVTLQFPFIGYAISHVLCHLELAYGGGALKIEILDRVPVKLVISSRGLLWVSYDVPNVLCVQTTTLLYVLLEDKHHSLAKGLLEYRMQIECSQLSSSQKTGESNIMFDVNALCGAYNDNALVSAAAYGDSSLVRLILDLGAEVNRQGGNSGSPLVAAVRSQREDNVQLLLKRGANVDAETYNGVNALVSAITSNSVRLVSLLLEHGSDASSVIGPYGSALGSAIRYKNLYRKFDTQDRIVRLLLAHGAKVNSWTLESPLWIAASLRDTDMMQLMLDHGADVDSRDCEHSMTPLYMVASGTTRHGAERSSESQLSAMKILLESGADMNATCEPYGTPLITAIAEYQLDAAKTLLAYGADIHHRSRYGTALDVALDEQLTEILRTLWDASFHDIDLAKRGLCHNDTTKLWDDTRSENNGHPRRRPPQSTDKYQRFLAARDSMDGLYTLGDYQSNCRGERHTGCVEHRFDSQTQLSDSGDSTFERTTSSGEEVIVREVPVVTKMIRSRSQSRAYIPIKPVWSNSKRSRASTI